MAEIVEWSPDALLDVEEIAQYIARDSLFYAKTVVEKILNSTRRLIKYPNSGRIVPEFNSPQIREIFVYSYRVIYRIVDDRITVAAVIHGSRLLSNFTQRLDDIH